MPARPKLKAIVAALEKTYGKAARFPSVDPRELILRENAAYLVDDATREEVFRSLKAGVGVTPEEILGAPYERLVGAIREGGMRPPMRAAKLVEAAEIAREAGLDPGCGRSRERAALRRASSSGASPESAGPAPTSCFSPPETRSPSRRKAVAPELPQDRSWLVAAHQLLRRHGQETCRRSEPRCEICPLVRGCDFARES